MASRREILRIFFSILAAAHFSFHWIPVKAHSQPSPKMSEKEIAKAIRKKIDTLNGLIEDVNKKLQLRTSGEEIFDRKRYLENQLRDAIIEFKLVEQALKEAKRLAKELDNIHRLARKGPKDPRRLRLANFLDARRREYVTFATH